MKPSFAQFMRTRLAMASLSCLLLAGCATLPPPTQELAQAQQAVAMAGNVAHAASSKQDSDAVSSPAWVKCAKLGGFMGGALRGNAP